MTSIEANPFIDAQRFERRAPPCTIVIFGANGDLTKRKLMPSLYRLAYERRIPPNFAVLGSSRTKMDDETFRAKMCEDVKKFLEDSPFDQQLWDNFARGLYYLAGDLSDQGFYQQMSAKLDHIAHDHQTGGNVLFYLSIQPSYYQTVVERLGSANLQQADKAWRRVIIEKPFGHDRASARELDTAIHNVFPEKQVYRIDHYLGKETVQNILAFRFGNGIFEPLWNRRYISAVQITGAESIGVEGRGGYYQEAGALRDMIQNHLLQVMATVSMEPPAAFEPNSMRDERAKLLRSVKIMKPDEVSFHAVAGQYRGFRGEQGVDPNS